MARLLEDRQQVSAFHQMPGVHHPHAASHVRYHAHVVGDEQDGGLGISAEFLEAFQYLGLQSYVNAGCYLVGNEQARAHDQRHSQHDALTLTAAEGERISRHHAAGIGNAQFAQHLLAYSAGGAAVQVGVGDDDLSELLTDGLHRVQGRLGILKDQGHGLATQLPQVFCGGGYQVDAVEKYPAAGDRAVVGKKAHHGQGQRALAGPTFADYTEHLLLFLGQRDAVDGVDDAVGYAELHPQVLNFQDRRHINTLKVPVASQWSGPRAASGRP